MGATSAAKVNAPGAQANGTYLMGTDGRVLEYVDYRVALPEPNTTTRYVRHTKDVILNIPAPDQNLRVVDRPFDTHRMAPKPLNSVEVSHHVRFVSNASIGYRGITTVVTATKPGRGRDSSWMRRPVLVCCRLR
jgi:hypothetical protein